MHQNDPPLALKLTAVLGALLAVGCSDSARELKFKAMPEELADCRVYGVSNADGQRMTVVRCPFSTTTTQVQSGKTRLTTVTIDGIEYAPVAK